MRTNKNGRRPIKNKKAEGFARRAMIRPALKNASIFKRAPARPQAWHPQDKMLAFYPALKKRITMSDSTTIVESKAPGSLPLQGEATPWPRSLQGAPASGPAFLRDLGLDFHKAAERLNKVVNRTPLTFNHNLSRKYGCRVFLKREDLQVVSSYKLRGAYNVMVSLPTAKLKNAVECATPVNHAQGFAYSCRKLGVKAVVFIPILTPKQKLTQTKMFAQYFIEIFLTA